MLLEKKGLQSFSQINQTIDLNKIENPTKWEVVQTSWETLPFVYLLLLILNFVHCLTGNQFNCCKMSFQAKFLEQDL